MAASVLQDRGLIERMQSMVDQTDVEMAKEDRGLTTFTLYLVSIFLISLIVETVRGKPEGTFETLYSSDSGIEKLALQKRMRYILAIKA